MSDEIEIFDGFLEGDDFVNEQAKEEEAARQRRLKRKRRLEKMQQGQENEPATPVLEKLSQGSLDISKQADQINKRDAGTSSIPRPSRVGNDTLVRNQNRYIIDKKDADANEFDMFSSSVSPPLGVPSALRNQNNNNLSGKVDKQQDWDDAEGYYKATIGQ